ncbi:MAG: phosphatidylglycerophosphate synthase [Candidatus Poriferisodalaceae bacterium]|jgi:phosphatidylglycerophosphate synthase
MPMNDKMTRLVATKTPDDEWWSSFVTAPMAILFNYLVVDLVWLTPNLLTLASFVTAVIAAALVLLGGTLNFVLAAVLIHLSHVFDCMDGQMARYRRTTSASGSFFDRATDQIQVALWFGAVAYAAYDQSAEVLPILLAYVGVSFYSLRGYTKYIEIHIEVSRDRHYLDRDDDPTSVQTSSGIRWLAREQIKILHFDEGVFIFMLSLALILNQLTPMLWIFALSQTYLGVSRTLQRGRNIELARNDQVQK